MTQRMLIVGAGALGGYVGGTLAHLGHDVTLIDAWPAHVETIRARGLELDGMTPEERFTVTRARLLHVTDVQSLAREKPFDLAMIAVKSYDTEWATLMIRPFLSATACVASLQNCINEEKIAQIVGWGRTIGIIASVISVDLHEAGRIRRTVAKGREGHTVFRIGEAHGRVTRRVEKLVELFRGIDTAKATTNLWGERWSKLAQNGMANGVTASTGLTSGECLRNDAVRRFSIKLASEAVRIGQALGFQLEKIRGCDPEQLALAGEGNAKALAEVEALLIPKGPENPRAAIQRPSMAQDILKGRRTEIEFMNGHIAARGAELGIAAPSHEKLTALVTKVERGELEPAAAHLGG